MIPPSRLPALRGHRGTRNRDREAGHTALPDTTALSASAPVAAAKSANTTDHARLRAILHRLTTVDGGPGALVEVRNRTGRTVLTSGVADVRTHASVHRDSRFRIGSMTKMFLATVMLQVVGVHRVVLDAPVERCLPGVVRGHGNDGRKIIERVTGRTYGEEIRRRVITPLGLRETYVPGDASEIPGPHPCGYVRPGEDAPLRDITAINPTSPARPVS
ncbi:serine hydrolase domain-containing protein [Streptomyces sp. MS1.AVA.1]|uniref:Serine hydrolase domain-containing protein n=1 Tax=Streptomyces machairae TaxID=3134109 RepID=A0ABU8UUB2_9ACTN